MLRAITTPSGECSTLHTTTLPYYSFIHHQEMRATLAPACTRHLSQSQTALGVAVAFWWPQEVGATQ